MQRIIGTEVEYGISSPSDPTANPILTSTQAVPGVRGRRGHSAGQADAVGLRGRITSARRAGLRPQPGNRPSADRGRRRGRCGEHDPDQRRAPVRRSRPPGVLGPRGDRPAGCGHLGQGGGARHGGRGQARGKRAGGGQAPALQEQRRRQGRVVRLARELPDEPADPVLGRHRGADAVPGVATGRHRLRAGGHRSRRRRARFPAHAARRLHRGRGRTGDHPQARDHQHPRRAARRRGQVPPPARHHRRREPRRDVHLPQGGVQRRWCST